GTFQVADGGGLRTTAPLTVLGFDSFRLEGNFTAGWDTAASTPAVVMTDSDIIIGSTATFSLSSALAARAEVGMVLMETVGGRILAATDLASSVSMYGKVGYAVNGPGTTVVIDSLANVVTGDGSAADRAVAAANLRTVWGGAHIGTDLAGILYDAGFGRLAAQIDSAAGEKNLALFQAIASPAGGSVGRDSLEYLNGAHLYGFTAVAVSTARQFRRSLVDRLRSVAGAAMGPDPVSSDAAVAAIEDTDRRGDRMWLGSFGLWENAGSRGGFSGYRYDAHGFLGGYDTAVGEGLAVGGAFAYATGSYQDKGAAAHDSAITSYSVAAYGGYSHPAGMTASLFGAYAYADNSLRELRRDPGAGLSWSEADYRTDTWSLGGDWGWVLRPRTNVRISPTLGLHYIYTRAGDHDMALGGVVTQRERSIRQTGVFLPMEVNASYDLPTDDGGLFRLDAGLGYTYNFRSGGVRGSIDYLGLTTGASASVRSRDQNRHSGHAGLGLQYHRDRFAIGVRYACTVENSYHAHHLTGGVSLQF
ncbi:MAG: autotransporter outer membrane beta-barrel domain-containing protein, partial [Planctomycetes bacterium]|nr:autotransporter outer membrane beta-barrel domain-containing protein [Planctomycetota bacterium]